MIPTSDVTTRRPAARERTPDEVAKMQEILDGKTTELPFSINAMNILAKRYLLHTHDGKILESPEEMFTRVAKALAKVEYDYGKEEEEVNDYAKKFEEIMVNFEFTPAGRTIANAGGPTRVVSNCIVLHINDSMDHIFQTLYDASLLQQAGSGLGFPLHLLRPAGFTTKKSYGQASGPVSFLHVYNTAFGVIKQQNRHGANMAVMSVSHPDILEFIHCKDKEFTIKNFNVSIGLTDEFMSQVKSNTPEPWMCEWAGQKMLPRRITRDANFAILEITEVRMTARQIFDEIVSSAWGSGEPGTVFLDTVNKVNPLPGLGPIHSCNPCGEQFLHDGDVCNLGSLNLEKFVKDGDIDEPHLRYVTRLAVRMLDNVIDISDFPVERVNSTFRANRRVGLGIMGFADMLYLMNVGYATPEGRAVAERVMAIIEDAATGMSEELAKEKGVFPNYPLSIHKKNGRLQRNAAVTNIAPTGTIAMMFDVSGGVEPYFALAYYYKGILGGDVQLSYVNKHLKRALQERGLDTPEIVDKIIKNGSLQAVEEIPADMKSTFVTAMDISAEAHIEMQAAMQRHCDNAISKTINFPNSASKDDILRGYLAAWEAGCKGCTVYRDGSRTFQVLNLNKDKDDGDKAEGETAADAAGASSAAAEAADAAMSDDDDDDVFSLTASQRHRDDDLFPESNVEKYAFKRQISHVLTEVAASPAKLRRAGSKRKAGAMGDGKGLFDENIAPDAAKAAVATGVSAPPTKKPRTRLTECPECGNRVTYMEGCFTCIGCGLSACSG